MPEVAKVTEDDSTIPPAAVSSKARRSRGRRLRPWSRRSKMLAVLLAIVILVSFFIALFLSIRLFKLSDENSGLIISVRQSQIELDKLRPEVEELRAGMNDLVEGRIPNLRPLEFDKVIALDENYVKNIAFTLASNADEKRYEYKFVMNNQSIYVVWPRVRILMFDNMGIQVGLAEMRGDYSANSQSSNLAPSEVRSYSSKIVLTEGDDPVYFRLLAFNDNPSAGESGDPP